MGLISSVTAGQAGIIPLSSETESESTPSDEALAKIRSLEDELTAYEAMVVEKNRNK